MCLASYFGLAIVGAGTTLGTLFDVGYMEDGLVAKYGVVNLFSYVYEAILDARATTSAFVLVGGREGGIFACTYEALLVGGIDSVFIARRIRY